MWFRGLTFTTAVLHFDFQAYAVAFPEHAIYGISDPEEVTAY